MREYVVLPIESNDGKYVVVNLEDDSLVLIAQSRAIFGTHTDMLLAFDKAQKEGPEAVLSKYDEYDKTRQKLHEMMRTEPTLFDIRSKEYLVRALEEFSQMAPEKKTEGIGRNSAMKGGGEFKLSNGIFTFHGTSETYWSVDKTILEHFRGPLKRFYEQSGNPLESIVIE